MPHPDDVTVYQLMRALSKLDPDTVVMADPSRGVRLPKPSDVRVSLNGGKWVVLI